MVQVMLHTSGDGGAHVLALFRSQAAVPLKSEVYEPVAAMPPIPIPVGASM